MKSDLVVKCKKIKLVLTDVDGVLTDGGMYYSQKGDVLKKFYVRDGMGVTLLRKSNIHTVIVTKEKNEMIRQWAKKMKIKKLYDGVMNKESIISKVCEYFGVVPTQIAYIGDDVNDVGLLKKVGLSAVPNDGIKEVKSICDYICKNNGGKGAFRELVDLILLTQKIIAE
jgi:YrbI family 3-deoxy-D-manno-octulosonate 8-phosphate phosphatase